MFIDTGKMSFDQGKFILFGLLAFCSTVAVGNPVEWKKCANVKTLAEINSVDITPCKSQPCVFHKGTTVKCTIKFTPKEDVTNGTLETFGIISGVKVPFPLPQPKACQDHGLDCPLKQGVQAELTISLAVKEAFPSIQLLAWFDCKDQSGEYLFCLELPARIDRGVVMINSQDQKSKFVR